MSKESWILFALNLIIKLAIRAGLATVISGARTFLDFGEAAGYFAVGEGAKGILNLLYAVGRLVTPGALTFWTDAVGQIAKEPILLAASKAEAERKATDQVGTELASKELAEIVQVDNACSMFSVDGHVVIEKRQQYLAAWRRN